MDFVACTMVSFTALFYPFRIFNLLARLKGTNRLIALINTVYRTLPGIFLYLVIAMLVSIGWSLSFFLIFSPYLSSMSSFFKTFCLISTTDLFQLEEYNDFILNSDRKYLGLFGLLLTTCKLIFLVLFIALATHLYN
jgi:hypothetical protein